MSKPKIMVELADEATVALAEHIVETTCLQLSEWVLVGNTILFDLDPCHTDLSNEDEVEWVRQDVELLLEAEEIDFHTVTVEED